MWDYLDTINFRVFDIYDILVEIFQDNPKIKVATKKSYYWHGKSWKLSNFL